MICIICDFFLAQLFMEYCLCPRGMGKRVKIESFMKLSVPHSCTAGLCWYPTGQGKSTKEIWVWCQWTEDLSGHALETSRISTYWFQQNLEDVVFQGGSCSTQQKAQRSPVDIKEPHR